MVMHRVLAALDAHSVYRHTSTTVPGVHVDSTCEWCCRVKGATTPPSVATSTPPVCRLVPGGKHGDSTSSVLTFPSRIS